MSTVSTNVRQMFRQPVAASPKSADSGFRTSEDADKSQTNPDLVPTLAGGIVGAAVGGGIMWQHSVSQVEKLPVNTVTESWRTPVMTDKVLGQIPTDTYQPTGLWAFVPSNLPMREVRAAEYGGTPQLNAQGLAILQNQTQSFTGHGNPLVTWESRPIQAPSLDPSSPYRMYSTPVTHTEYRTQYDSEGNLWEVPEQVTDGHRYSFSPNVRQSPVQSVDGATTYQVPKVAFETGVNVALNTVLGAGAGFAAGAVAGWLIGRAVRKAA